jgi:hypothetical protein
MAAPPMATAVVGGEHGEWRRGAALPHDHRLRVPELRRRVQAPSRLVPLPLPADGVELLQAGPLRGAGRPVLARIGRPGRGGAS